MSKEEKLPKFCIFCGKKPNNKTKEHIIPQWLIKLTGDPQRKIHLGIDTQALRENHEFKIRTFSFQNFQFPACSDCNNKYSNLESDSRNIIVKILNKEYINETEINSLLDWFDKVRTGLWLSFLLLDRNGAPVNPKFFINNRVASKDRSLLIYEMNDDWKGVQFTGVNSPGFQFSPSCFSLTINNLCFFNYSYEFVVSKNLGFPYEINVEFVKDDPRLYAQMTKGKEKINKRILPFQYLPPSMELYQPIFSRKLVEQENEDSLYQSDYINNHSLDFTNGIGKIFFRDENVVKPLEDDMEIIIADNYYLYDRNQFRKKSSNQIMEVQSEILKRMPSTKNLDSQTKANILKSQEIVIKQHNKFRELT